MIIYDATRLNLTGIPDKVYVLYENELVTNDEPDYDKIMAQSVHNGKRLCVDIERWKFDNNVAQSVSRYIQAITWVREACPDSDIGLYQGQWSFFDLMGHNWQSYLDLLNELEPLYNSLDTIYLSAYVVYDKPDIWKFYLANQIGALMRFNKPIIPFIWHRGAGSIYDGDEIGSGFMRETLTFLESLTIARHPVSIPFIEGVAVWMKSDETERPASSAPWWVELQRFL